MQVISRSSATPARGLRRAVLLMAGLLLLTACDVGTSPPPPPPATADPTADATPTSRGTFRYGIGEPRTIIPPSAATPDDRAVVDAVFDSLTSWDADGRAIPSAAVSWEPDDDATTWRFVLRPGAVFHDGTPVTAAHFARAWDLAAATGPMGHLLSDVDGYDAVRDGRATTLDGVTAAAARVLEVRLVRPRGDLPVVVGHPALGPLPDAHGEDALGFADLPIGNGPFRMTEPWARGEFIRVARWESWLNGRRPDDGVGEVVFRIADQDINFLAFSQGRRDLTSVPIEALDLAAAQFPPEGEPDEGPGLITIGRPEVYVLAVNRTVAPYDDVAVREAVSLAVDRGAVVADNRSGVLIPATSLLPPVLPGAAADSCDRCTYNPSGAGDRLDEVGATQLTLAYNADGGHEAVRDVLRGALSDLGVSLVSNGRQPAPPLAAYQDALVEGGVGLFRLPFTADVPSALPVLQQLVHSEQGPVPGGGNLLRYDDATVDRLLDRAARTTDDDRREALLRRVEDIVVNRDQVVVPIITYRHAMVASPAVRDLRFSPFGLVDLTAISMS